VDNMLPNRLTRLRRVVKRKGGKLREVIVKTSRDGLVSAHSDNQPNRAD
jgi:hypothetical protein